MENTGQSSIQDCVYSVEPIETKNEDASIHEPVSSFSVVVMESSEDVPLSIHDPVSSFPVVVMEGNDDVSSPNPDDETKEEAFLSNPDTSLVSSAVVHKIEDRASASLPTPASAPVETLGNSCHSSVSTQELSPAPAKSKAAPGAPVHNRISDEMETDAKVLITAPGDSPKKSPNDSTDSPADDAAKIGESKKDLTCELCEKVFTTKKSLKRHHSFVHSVECYKCPHCEKSFKEKSQLFRHVRAKHTEKPFECNTCGKAFLSADKLQSHKLVVHKKKKIRCNVCGKLFKELSQLGLHVVKGHPDGSVCKTCNVKFEDDQALEQHRLAGPCGKPSHQCDRCPKMFHTKASLQRHILCHTGERPFLCNICGQSYKDKSTLKMHIRVHTGEKPYKCEFCPKIFCRGSNLRGHMMIHRGEKPVKRVNCDICAKSFCSSTYLKRHLRLHTGEKPFSCDECGKQFRHKNNLKKHCRIHTGEKPFNCPHCNKTFADDGNCKRHIRIHTGERPYSCKICLKTFTQSSSLTAHSIKHMAQGSAARAKSAGKNKFQVAQVIYVGDKAHQVQPANVITQPTVPPSNIGEPGIGNAVVEAVVPPDDQGTLVAQITEGAEDQTLGAPGTISQLSNGQGTATLVDSEGRDVEIFTVSLEPLTPVTMAAPAAYMTL